MSPILDRLLVLVMHCRRIQPAGYELTLRVVPPESSMLSAEQDEEAQASSSAYCDNAEGGRKTKGGT